MKSVPRSLLRLLVGPAGTGKTHACLERLKAALRKRDLAHGRTVFVVPSQEHVDRITAIILHDPKLEGFGGAPIVTINTFLRALRRLEAGRRTITEVAKRAILRELIDGMTLAYFAQAKAQAGFVEVLSGWIRECKEHLVTPEAFLRAAARAGRADAWLGKKATELAQIYQAYQAQLDELEVMDEEDRSRWTLGHLKQWPRRAAWDLVMFDGFFDFTKFQLALLREVGLRSRETLVTLTLDRTRPELFRHVEQTYQALRAVGFRDGEERFDQPRRMKHADLLHLERALFRPEPVRDAPQATHLEILETTGAFGELEWIARRILQARAQAKLHFSDFAVIFRTIGDYEPLIQSVFRQFRIPVTIHERRRLAAHPLIQRVMDTLELFAEGWPRERVWRLLRSQWLVLRESKGEPPALAQFERRALTEAVEHGREAWLAVADGVGGVLAQRFHDLAAIEDRLRGMTQASPLMEGARAVMRMWMAPPQPDQKKGQALFAEEREKGAWPFFQDVREEGGAWRAFEQLVEQWAALAHRRGLSLEGLVGDLRGAVQTALYSVPTLAQNAVQVYDVSLARQKAYRVVFLAGLLEKRFPQQIREDPLLRDTERRALNQEGLSASSDSRQAGELLAERLPRIALERYLFYLGVTRAEERLILTYPKYDTAGNETLPSFYVDEVRRLFPQGVPTTTRTFADLGLRAEEITTRRDLEEFILSELFHRPVERDGAGRLAPLVLYNRHRDRLATAIHLWERGEQALIRDPRIQAWFREQRGPYSPTRLEVFGKCPFKYFAEKVIGLQEPVGALDALTIGSMAHRVLEEFYRRTLLKAPSKEHWVLLTNFEQAKTHVQAILDELHPEWEFALERPYQRRLVQARLFDLLVSVLEKEAEYERKRQTVPRHVELAFGFGATPEEIASGARYDYVRVPSGREEILLEGKIDRVDLHPTRPVGLVVDYKLGKEFRPQDFDEGLSLQLPVYLLALRQVLNVEPAGAEFVSLSKLRRSGIYQQDVAKGVGAMSGRDANQLDRERFEELLERAQAFIREDVQGIRSARIAVAPKNCDWCALTSVCRFEKWRLAFRRLETPRGER